MIDVKAFTLGDLATNCYLLEETISGEMAVVDPATDEIIDILKSLNCDFSKIKYICNKFAEIGDGSTCAGAGVGLSEKGRFF